jgi:hypothetical protein
MIDLTEKITAWYKLNENRIEEEEDDILVADSSGCGNDGTARNDTGLTSTANLHIDSGNPPNLNGAFEFDSSIGEYIDCGDIDALDLPPGQDVAIAFWVKTSNDGVLRIVINKVEAYAGDWKGWLIGEINNSIIVQFFYGSGDSAVTAFKTVTAGDWHFIVVNIDRDANLSISADGGAASTVDISDYESADLSNGGSLLIARKSDPAVSASDFNGCLDNIMLFNAVLTEEEKTFLCNSGAGIELLSNLSIVNYYHRRRTV